MTEEDLEELKKKWKVDENIQEYLHKELGEVFTLDQIRETLNPGITSGSSAANGGK